MLSHSNSANNLHLGSPDTISSEISLVVPNNNTIERSSSYHVINEFKNQNNKSWNNLRTCSDASGRAAVNGNDENEQKRKISSPIPLQRQAAVQETGKLFVPGTVKRKSASCCSGSSKTRGRARYLTRSPMPKARFRRRKVSSNQSCFASKQTQCQSFGDVRSMSQISRQARIQNWIHGKYSSKELEAEDKIMKSPDGSQAKTSLVVGSSKIHNQVRKLKRKDLHDSKTNSFASKPKKVSHSTAKRRQFRKKKVPSISSESEACKVKYIRDHKRFDDTLLTWSNQSHVGQTERRRNALRDKLQAKGQNSVILDLLDTNQFTEALDMTKEGHCRIRLEVCLLWACMRGNSEMVSCCLKNGASVDARDAEGYGALHLASESGSLDCVKKLVESGARVTGPSIWDNKGEVTPLMMAAKIGDSDIVGYLASKGMDVNAGLKAHNRTALHFAVQSGSEDCVQHLIAAGSTLNPIRMYSETPLHTAVEEGYSEIVQLLLNGGADVRAAKGASKTTCLHIAAQGSYYHIAHQLLKSGADPNQMDSRGRTPLHYASKAQCLDTVQVLINYRANANAKDFDGKSPLHLGIFKGSRSFECLKLLLEAGANPNLSDNAGYTPVHLAALNESTACVVLFLKYGADLTRKTRGGTTAMSVVLRRTPTVMNHIQESLNSSINFVDTDKQLEREGQIQLDFSVLLAGSQKGPECPLLSSFIKENQKALLKHPLCQTFLYLKWTRVRTFFVFNVAFYGLLVGLLTELIYMVFLGTSAYEIGSFSSISNATHISQLKNNDKVSHGTISPRRGPEFETECFPINLDHPRLHLLILYISWIFLGFLTLKETFQMLDSPKFYFGSLDNILVWPVMIGSFLITVSTNYNHLVCPWQFHVAALVVLIGWIELLLLVGRFPLFGIYVHMFAQVSKNVGKFLFTYICLISAFSCSFGILFHNQKPFNHRFLRILKTLMMMTGEVEYDEWFYEKGEEERILYSGTSHFVFAAFLIFVIIILMNLLVGLAVSDIQGLQKSAGLDRLVRQTELISHFENFMFSPWLKYIIPQRLLTILHDKIRITSSFYGSMIIINSSNLTGVTVPSDVMEGIKRVARNRDHSCWKRHTFANFRSLSNTVQIESDIDTEVSRSLDAIRCGIDILMWDSEDRQKTTNKLLQMLSSTYNDTTCSECKKRKSSSTYLRMQESTESITDS